MKRIIKSAKKHGLVDVLRILKLRFATSIKTIYGKNPEFANKLNLYHSERNIQLRKKVYEHEYEHADPAIDYLFFTNFYKELCQKASDRKLKELVLINSGVTFDATFNQRPLNFARHAAQNDRLVLFIVWQWYPEEPNANAYKEVYPNIIEIPMYKFLGTFDLLSKHLLQACDWEKKSLLITLPAQVFSPLIYKARMEQFHIAYDIMDEWEEFHKLGQAIWYRRETEEEFILNADAIFAVSKPLIEKFSHLRSDICLNSNGYSEEMLKESNRFIVRRTKKEQPFKVGYFGHLTESWFDWELVFELASIHKTVIFEIIGYGCSAEILDTIKRHPNIHYLGQKKHHELINYAKQWCAGLIPFKQSTLSMAVDPIKIYEYLFFGLPVIVSGIPHLESYPDTWVGKNAREFAQILDELIKDKAVRADQATLEAFLFDAQWDERFKQLFIQLYNNTIIPDFIKS